MTVVTLPAFLHGVLVPTRAAVSQDVLLRSAGIIAVPFPALMWAADPDGLAASVGDPQSPCYDMPLAYRQLPHTCVTSGSPIEPALNYQDVLPRAVAEILLCFCPAVALRAGGRRGHGGARLAGWFLSPLDSARDVLRSLPVVAVHLALLHLAVAGGAGLFAVLPTALSQTWVVPDVVYFALGDPWCSLLRGLALDGAAILIGSFGLAFCAVYSARLFARLVIEPAHRTA